MNTSLAKTISMIFSMVVIAVFLLSTSNITNTVKAASDNLDAIGGNGNFVNGGTYNIESWSIETVVNSNVSFPYLVLDSDNNPWIAYKDVTPTVLDLKIAQFNGSAWQFDTVDQVGDAGYWTALTLGPEQQPHLTWANGTDLRYGFYDGSNWQSTTIHSGTWPKFTSIFADASNYAHVSHVADSNDTIRYKWQDAGGWHEETVLQTNGDMAIDMASDSLFQPHLVYQPWNNTSPAPYTLKYAWRDTTWHIESVTDLNYGRVAIAVGSNNLPYILRENQVTHILEYFSKNGSTWVKEDVTPATYGGISLAFDWQNYPHAVYTLQGTNGDQVMYAHMDGNGWHTEKIADGYPENGSLAIGTNGEIWIAYTSNTGALQLAHKSGFHVSGRNILDANGNNFIMRGINHLYTFYLKDKIDENEKVFADIKATGANTVRVVLSSGDYSYYDKNGIKQYWKKTSASDVANAISFCKSHHLICILSVHDTTGYGQDAGAVSLDKAVNYWKEKEIKETLDGSEKYVIINIGNEPYGNVDIDGNGKNINGWVADTTNAIKDMRAAGFNHMLMVDAPNWGGDNSGEVATDFRMRDNAKNIFASDLNKNTVFSVHMYERFQNQTKIGNYVKFFVDAGLPLVIGEFGYKHVALCPDDKDTDTDQDAIMETAQSNGIGYMGWAWSSNNDCKYRYLNMVINFDPNQMTWWGNRIIGGENGICPTAHEASVYGGTSGPNACSITLNSIGAQDGWVLESAETSNKGGTKNNIAPRFNLGDDAANKQYRSLLSFNTSTLPDDAILTKVTLKVKKNDIAGGGDPVTIFGGFLVDIKKGFFRVFPGTASLASSDFQAAADKSYGPFKPKSVGGWYSINLPAATAYINKLTTSSGLTQFRLRFKLDDNNNAVANYISFYSGNSAINKPMLTIQYYMP